MKVKNILVTTLLAGTVAMAGMSYAGYGYDGPGCDNKYQSRGYNGECSGKGRHFYGDRHYENRHDGDFQRSTSRRMGKMDRMAEMLDFSDAQKQQVKALMETDKSTIQALREKKKELKKSLHSLDPAASDYTSKLNALADQKADLTKQFTLAKGQKRQKMFSILTPEQQTKMQEMKDKRKQCRNKRNSQWK